MRFSALSVALIFMTYFTLASGESDIPFQDCDTCPIMVPLPEGPFTMGYLAPAPVREEWKGERKYDRAWESSKPC